MSAIGLALQHRGANQATSVTVLTDGDAGLRAIQQQVAPHADHVLDWFHISMVLVQIVSDPSGTLVFGELRTDCDRTEEH